MRDLALKYCGAVGIVLRSHGREIYYNANIARSARAMFAVAKTLLPDTTSALREKRKRISQMSVSYAKRALCMSRKEQVVRALGVRLICSTPRDKKLEVFDGF